MPSSISNDGRGEEVETSTESPLFIGVDTSDPDDVLEIIYEPGSHGTRGTIRYENGDVYEGEIKGGKEHGKGVCSTSSGDIYYGEWTDGWMHGEGTLKWEDGDVYVGEWKRGDAHGRGTATYAPGGEVSEYEGEWKDGEPHGRGSMTYASGDVYEGGLKDGKRHGRGLHRLGNGNVQYDGEWKDGKYHGTGTYHYGEGAVYEGDFENGWENGRGVCTWPSGTVYEGEWMKGKHHGEGTYKWIGGEVYEGQWVDGERNGRGSMKYTSGDVYEGQWVDGKPQGEGVRTDGREEKGKTNSGKEQPEKEKRVYNGRKLRSQRSQLQRLEKNAAIKVCENCGVDDYKYKLRACSGCDLGLYCSAACQRRKRGSHQRICSIVSELPPRDADRLALKYDKGKMVDLDAGLRYAAKYMDYLKHLEIDIRGMASNDAIKLSEKQLSSLLRSKKGTLSSFSWETKACTYCDEWGNELHGLKQLRLVNMYCDKVQHIQDVLSRQRSTLMVLDLPRLEIDWHRAKCRRTIALAVASCKSMVKLQLDRCVLMDSDLKIMLQDLPNLRILHLSRSTNHSHELTDNTCGLIARKCPGLQELSLVDHSQLSVRGVRKIFYGCPHLRAFYTTTHKLTGKDVQTLLDTAPQLMYLSLNERLVAGEDLDEIIEATGGRTLIQFNDVGDCQLYEPGEGVSAETREAYDLQSELGDEVIRRSHDPDVINEWEHLVEG